MGSRQKKDVETTISFGDTPDLNPSSTSGHTSGEPSDDSSVTTSIVTEVTNLVSGTIVSAVPNSPPNAMPDFIGPYKVIKKLGQGGMGQVFLCQDMRSPGSPEVAVKTIFSDLLVEPEIAKRFDAEVKLLGSISHPGVVHMIEHGTFDVGGQATRYMAMERIDGVSLYTLCQQRRLSISDILNISVQLANGLQSIHDARVIHRDLKPGNVLVGKDGHVKIIDFGIAKPTKMSQFGSEDATRGFKTQTGIIIGTVNYLAPEVLRDQSASNASDIYALGLIIWEMLNGKVPFKAENLAETINLVTTKPLLIAPSIRAFLPAGFNEFYERMVSKTPQVRPETAREVADEMLKFLGTVNLKGSIARKSRFDLDIRWSNETIARIKGLEIADPEVGLVLQAIEDHLVEQFDARVNSSTEPINVSDSIVKKCVALYRRARFETISHLRNEALEKNGVVEISPLDRMTISEKKLPAAFSRTAAALAVICAFACAVYIGLAKHPDRMAAFETVINNLKVHFSQLRNPAAIVTNVNTVETGQAAAQPLGPESPKANLFSGRTLVYRISTQIIGNSITASEESRVLQSFSDRESVWLVDGVDVVHTPRSFLPVEAYFHPVYRKRNTNSDKDTLPVDFFPLVAGRMSYANLVDEGTSSIETLQCTPIGSRKMTIEMVEQDLWKIQCVRDVFLARKLTHKIIETYQYAPNLEAVIFSELKVTTLDANDAVTATSVYHFDLQIGRSKL